MKIKLTTCSKYDPNCRSSNKNSRHLNLTYISEENPLIATEDTQNAAVVLWCSFQIRAAINFITFKYCYVMSYSICISVSIIHIIGQMFSMYWGSTCTFYVLCDMLFARIHIIKCLGMNWWVCQYFIWGIKFIFLKYAEMSNKLISILQNWFQLSLIVFFNWHILLFYWYATRDFNLQTRWKYKWNLFLNIHQKSLNSLWDNDTYTCYILGI